MSYLFLVHIGPVQDFIASARRSRDLAFGSWFLSEIARAAARAIVSQEGRLIFPALTQEHASQTDTSTSKVANKIIALMQRPPQTYGEEGLGQLVYAAMMERLDEFKASAYFGLNLSPEYSDIADRQIKNLVEFLWTAFPYEETANSEENAVRYASARRHVEALMAARKHTRDFFQMKGAYTPKSSIDGRLESIIPEEEFPPLTASEQQRFSMVRALYQTYGAGPAERLSGVDLLKRHGLTVKNIMFPSTGHIAAQPFLRRLLLLNKASQAQAQAAWSVYIEKAKQIGKPRYDERLQSGVSSTVEPAAASLVVEQDYKLAATHPVLGQYDGTMLFEERLTELAGPILNQQRLNEQIQDAKAALRSFYQVVDRQFTALGLSTKRPNPYYALLQADGDGMGDVIEAQAKRGYQRHQQLSRQLASFADGVDGIVKKHRGALVYAGGDDVLAFLPLDTAIACARELAARFKEDLHAFEDDQGHSPTLSVGVAIVHYLDSLKQARNLAFEAERRAKKQREKNALAITVSKRSGEDYGVVGKWGIIDRQLNQLVDRYCEDAIPAGTPYELRDMLLRLTTEVDLASSVEERQYTLIETLPQVIRWDAMRILKRKLYVPQGKFSQQQVEALEQFFKTRLSIKDTEQLGDEAASSQRPVAEILREYQDCIEEMTQFIHELIIAQVLADARQMAQPEKEKKRS